MATRSHDRDDDEDVESRHASGSQDSDVILEAAVVGEATVGGEATYTVGLLSTLNLTVSKCMKFMP